MNMRHSDFKSIAQTDTLKHLQKRFIQIVSICGIITSAIGLVTLFAIGGVTVFAVGAMSVFLLLSIGVLLVVRGERLILASVMIVTVFVIGDFVTPLSTPVLPTLILISAATLLTQRGFIIINLIVFGKQLLMLAQVWPGITETTPMAAGERFAVITMLAVAGLTTRYFIIQTGRTAAASRRSTELLQAVAEIGQTLAKVLQLNELLNQSAELIRDRLAFYHVQIFLLNETGDTAQLVASTGEVGQKLLERQHQLPVGSKSVIGQVTSLGRPVRARDTDPVYYRNELLPDTRAELAVPILDGERIMGALDVQSRYLEAFDADRMQALQVMANLLATSIRNARLFELQARSAEETKRLYLETETNLREIQRLNQQLTRVGWEEYLRDRQKAGGVTLQDGRIVNENDWSENLTQAAQSRKPVTTQQDDGHSIIALPVMLGSEVIGAIEVESDRPVTQTETVEMMRTVAQRLALSLDKARLFEESQEATAQEQRINEIVARYQSVTNVDELLRITLVELSQTLGATGGAIRLSLAPQGEAVS